jgi:hypothetical protein
MTGLRSGQLAHAAGVNLLTLTTSGGACWLNENAPWRAPALPE